MNSRIDKFVMQCQSGVRRGWERNRRSREINGEREEES